MFSRRKRKFLLVLFTFVALLALSWGVYSYLANKRRIIVVSALQERLNALTQLKETLSVGPVPHAWDAGVYIPFEPINKTLDQLGGLSLASSTLIPGEDLELRVVQFLLGTSDAVASAAIEVEATSPSRKLSVTLSGNAQLSFDGVTEGSRKNMRNAHFSVQIMDLAPTGRLGNYRFVFGNAAGDLISAPLIEKINSKIKERLDLGIPFPCPSGISLGLSKTLPPTAAGKAKVTLKVEMPGKEIPLPTDFSSAVFTRQGVWLLISGKRLKSEPPKQATALATAADLLNAIHALEEELAPELRNVMQSKSVAMGWAHGRAMTKFLVDFGALPQKNRTFSARAEKCEGNFVEERWHDNILGEGGYRVGPTEALSLSVTGVIENPVSKWVPKAGLEYSIPVTGKSEGALYVHVDPLVGGGAGTSAGFQGPASTSISGRATFRQAKINGDDIIYVDPGNAALPLTAKAETDGKLVLDWGWTKVPKIGVTIGVALPPTVIPAFSIADDLPLCSYALNRLVNDAGFTFKGKEDQYLQVRLQPESAEALMDGFLLKSKFTITFNDTAADMEAIDGKREAIRLALDRHQTENSSPVNSETSIKIHVAGIEFGPNNDLVAFLKFVGKTTAEIIDIMKKAGHEVSPEKVEEWIRNPSDSFRRSDPGKGLAAAVNAADEAIRAVEDAARAAAAAAEERAQAVLRETEAAARAAAQAAADAARAAAERLNRAGRWIRGRF
jgi:hypothetical protein